MSNRVRSPFGSILREERRAQGISQAELAARIADRFTSDPDAAELGVVSDRAITNIEAAKASADEFVRPRPETVRVLMLALGIDPTTERGQAMLRAADSTHRREKIISRVSENLFQVPFVYGGRERHWQSLQTAWELVKSGQPQIRLIEGTAGLGKTRLVEEFCRSIRDNDSDYLIAIGECSSGAANIEPYLPWRRALSYAIRASMNNNESRLRNDYFASSLLGSVSKLGGVLIDLQDLQDWITHRAPERLSDLKRARESWSPTNTLGRYDQLMSLLSSVARVMPVAVVLEDLHWADESSCSLLLHLQRQMRLQNDMSLMVIGTYRASDLLLQQGSRHPLLHVINEMGRRQDNVVLSLESSVDNNRGLEFVTGLVDSFLLDENDRDELIELLYKRTHGHPLFTTELVQRLLESNALSKQTDERWVLDPDKVATELPNRMRAIIDERIQRLPSNARTIVEAASVQGSPFAIDVLPHVTGLSESEVDGMIDRELVELHHILQSSNEQDGLLYEFDHAVVAETIYDSLSPYRRQTLHRRTAEAFIAVNEHNLLQAAPIAAYHFEQANMLPEAAEQALLSSFATLAKLDHDLTLVWVDRSERLALAANEENSLWRARVRRAHVLRSMGTLLEARSLGYDAIAHAQRRGDLALEADAREVVALVAYDFGELDDASESWTRAIQSYEQIGRKDRVSACQSMLSHVACRTGKVDAAIRHAQAAWAAAPDGSRDGLGAEALLAEGNAMLELGRYKDAIDLYTRSLTTYNFTGEMRGIILCRMNIALCHARLGFLDRAFSDFEQLQIELSQLQTPRLQAFLSLYHGMTYEAAGDFITAKSFYEQALRTRHFSGLTAMSGDDLAGILRASIGEGKDIQAALDQLQAWWRTNDPRALEDPLLVMYTLVNAYEVLGQERLMANTLNEGARFFLERANQIQNPSIREMYLRGNQSGRLMLSKAKEAGLVQH